MTTTHVDLYRVILRNPVTYIPTGPTTGCNVTPPTPGSFDPARIRVTPVADIRPGDVVLGTIQPHYDRLLNPLDRAQWVSYFAGTPKPQTGGARPFDPAHCDWCTHHAHIGIGIDGDWFTVDGCTPYQADSLLMVIPRELAAHALLELPAVAS